MTRVEIPMGPISISDEVQQSDRLRNGGRQLFGQILGSPGIGDVAADLLVPWRSKGPAWTHGRDPWAKDWKML